MTGFLRELRRQGWAGWLLDGTTAAGSGRLENLLLRAVFAVLIWRSLDSWPAYSSLPFPVGMARWPWLWDALGWDLTRLGDPEFRDRCRLVVRVCLVLYTFGIAIPLALVPVAFVHIGIRTLNNSQGAAHHGYQMVSLAILAQLVAAWIGLIAGTIRRRKRNGARSPARFDTGTLMWRMGIAAAAATYVTSVFSKIDESHGKWLFHSHYIATQIVKTHRQNYYNHLDPRFIEGVPAESSDDADPAHDRFHHPIPEQAAWLHRHPHAARLLFGAGFFLELFAFLAVLGRRASLLIGLGLVSLHESIEWLMELTFPFNQLVVAVLFLNAGGWLILMSRRPEFRPGFRVWAGAIALEAALLAATLATPLDAGIRGHLIHSTQTAGRLIAELLRVPAPGAFHALTFAIQAILFAAVAVTIRSLAADWRKRTWLRKPAADPAPAGRKGSAA